MNASVIFWGLLTFTTIFAFTVKKRLCCLIIFLSGCALVTLYGVGIAVEQFLSEQMKILFDLFNQYSQGNFLISLGSGSFARWLGGQYRGE